MDLDDVAGYFRFKGKDLHKTFNSYENNYRYPVKGRLKYIAKLYEVNINWCYKRHDFSNLIDVIYNLMWLEEKFPYYEINFYADSY